MTLFNIVYILSNIIIVIEKLNSDQPQLMTHNVTGYNCSMKNNAYLERTSTKILPLKLLAGKLEYWNRWYFQSPTDIESKTMYKIVKFSVEIPKESRGRVQMWSVISNLCFVAGLIMDCYSFIALMIFLSTEPIDAIFPHQFLCAIMVMMSVFFDAAYFRLIEAQELASQLW